MRLRLFAPFLLALSAFGQSSFDSQLAPRFYLEGSAIPKWTIAERMQHYKVPGVSVAIIRNGKIAAATGYGVLEAGKPEKVNAETVFQAASISKPVAAAAALHMAQYGKFTLDEDVNGKLKSWKVPENEFTASQKVNLRRLLSHSAGLTVHGFPGYKSTAPVPTVVQLLSGEKPANTAAVKPDIEPGSRWRYSGGGYTVAQLLMTEQFGASFPDLMDKIVLKPAGMKRSTYQQPLPESWAGNAARAHNTQGVLLEGRWHTYPEMAAAGLWTTPTDLAKFAIEIWRSAKGESNRVLSREMAERMLTVEKEPYGLGFGLEGQGPKAQFGHGGSNEGFKCQLVMFRESGNGAVVMTNGDMGGALAGEVLRAIAISEGWPDFLPSSFKTVTLTEAQLKPYEGAYLVSGRKVTVTPTKNGLLVEVTGGPKSEVLPESATRFRALDGSVPPVSFETKDSEIEMVVGGMRGKRMK